MRARETNVRETRKRPGRPRISAPHPIDVHVGSRLRLRRLMLGLSQTQLANRVGLTFQQIQKYERGGNRIGASRLYELAESLDVPVSYFFDDMAEATARAGGATGSRSGRRVEPAVIDAPESRILSAYYRIGDPSVQKSLFGLMRAFGRMRDDESAEEEGQPSRRSDDPPASAAAG